MATDKLTTILDARDRASAKFRGVGRNARRMDTGLRRLGAGLVTYFSGRLIVGGLLGATQASEQYRRELAKVSTMLDDSTEHLLPAYKKELARLAVEYGDGTDSLSDGLYNVLSASIPAGNALTFLRDSAKAAVAGITDTNTAVDGATSLLNAFGWEASRSAEIFDLMFTTVKRGKLTFGELAGNVGKIAPVAKAANMSMGDTLALIATMTRQGYSVEQATTRIVALLKKFPDAGSDILGLLRQFEGKDLSSIMEVVPETRAAQAIAALAADLKGLTRDIDDMTKSAGAADEAYAKMADTRRFQRLGQAWVQMKRNIGDAINESATWTGVIDALIEQLPKIPLHWQLATTQIAYYWESLKTDAANVWDSVLAATDLAATQLLLTWHDFKADVAHVWAEISSDASKQIEILRVKAKFWQSPQRRAAELRAIESLYRPIQHDWAKPEAKPDPMRDALEQQLAQAQEAFVQSHGDRALTEIEQGLLQVIDELREQLKPVLAPPEPEYPGDFEGAGVEPPPPAGPGEPPPDPAAAARAAARAAAGAQGAEIASFSARFLTRGQGLAEPAWVKAWNARTAKDQSALRKDLKHLPDDIARAITQYLTADAVA